MSERTDAATAGQRASSSRAGGGLDWLGSLFICLGIALIGAAALGVIFQTEPEASRAAATREMAMLVDVTTVETGTHRPTVVATGTVRPAREIVIRPRVEGEVTDHSGSLVPGGLVAAGETLVRLDEADYQQILQQRRGALERARAELRMEQGRQRVAEKEYRITEQELSGESRALALRQPQLEIARAEVSSARAAVEQARLALERTTVAAPFDAQVLSREIDVGSQVAAGDALARLVGTDRYWVETTVPVAKLRWLAFPGDGQRGAPVRIHNPGAWPEDAHRSGRLFRLVGSLDDSTRMARVLVAVDDPLARDADPGTPRLLLGTYVEARIEGQTLADVVRLDRAHLRANDTVWVMRDRELDIREVDVAVRDDRYAYIRGGLEDGERVVTSSLATIQHGAPLRLSGPTADGADDANATADTGSTGP